MNLNLDQMRASTDKVISERINAANNKLLYSSEYSEDLEKFTYGKYQDSETILFNSDYFNFVAKEIGLEDDENYFYKVIGNNSILSMNTLCSKDLFIYLFRIDDDTSIANKFYIIDFLYDIYKRADNVSLNSNDDMIVLINKDNNYKKTGDRLVFADTKMLDMDVKGSYVGFTMANTNTIALIGNHEDDDKSIVCYLKGVTIVVDKAVGVTYFVKNEVWDSHKTSPLFYTMSYVNQIRKYEETRGQLPPKKYHAKDKFNILDGQIAGIEPISANLDFSLDILDRIHEKLDSVKGDEIIEYAEVLTDIENSYGTIRTSCGFFEYYTSIKNESCRKCVCVYHVYLEWRAENFLSSFMCICDMMISLAELLKNSDDVELIKYVNGMKKISLCPTPVSTPPISFTTGIVIKNKNSSISYNYEKNPMYKEDLHITGIENMNVGFFKKRKIDYMPTFSLFVETKDGTIYEMELPLITFNVTTEFDIKEDHSKICGIAIYQLGQKVSIDEGMV